MTSPQDANAQPHAIDVFCTCHVCHWFRIQRVDAFCQGLIAGLQLQETAVDGLARTGTDSRSSGKSSGLVAAPGASKVKTLRPPRF